MKKNLLLVFMFLSHVSFAQIKYGVFALGPKTQRSWKQIDQKGKSPLLITFLVCNRNEDFDSISVVADWDQLEKLSKDIKEKGRFSGITYHLKQGKSLMSMDDIMKVFHIAEKDRKLPIVVDDKYMDYPDDLYAVKSAIASVQVQKHWYTQQPVIYIRSTNPLPERPQIKAKGN